MAVPAWRSSGTTVNRTAINTSTVSVPPPPGHQADDLLLLLAATQSGAVTIDSPAGWTLVATTTWGGNRASLYWKKAASSSEPNVAMTTSAASFLDCQMYAFSGVNTSTPLDAATAWGTASATPVAVPAITTSTANALLVYLTADDAGHGWTTAPPGATQHSQSTVWAFRFVCGSEAKAAAGTEAASTYARAGSGGAGATCIVVALREPVTVTAPVADFSGAPLSGTAPLSVAFTDSSTNTPTSWAWTFGDGGTSTSQNPSHSYASAGSYTVALVATNAAGSDTETKTGYVTAAAAVVPPGGRFSVAFDDPTLEWAPTWTALDQEHPNLVTSWTVDRGRQYELDRTDGGRATVQISDPNGILDPTNPSGPYYGKIEPLLQAALCRWDPMEEEWQPRFRGWISELDYRFDPSQMVNRLTVELVDIFEILGAIEMLPGEFGDEPPAEQTELAGQVWFDTATMDGRVIQALTNAGIPTGFYIATVFSGNVDLYETVYSPGESPLTVIQEAADAEFPGVANAYADRYGRLAVHGRVAKFDPSAVIAGLAPPYEWGWHHWQAGDGAAVNADPGAVAQIRRFAFNRGLSKIINSALATPKDIADGAVAGQVYKDDDSIDAYGVRSWSAQNLLTKTSLFDDASALVETKRFAETVVENNKVPHNRVTETQFRSIRPGQTGSGYTWQLMSRVDIGDRIDVTVGSPGGGGFTNEAFYVEGIHESSKPLNLDYDNDTVSLDLSPVALFFHDPWVEA